MPEQTNAQVALLAATAISSVGAASSVVLSRADKFLSWLNESDAK